MRLIDADALKQQFIDKLVRVGLPSEKAEEFAKTAFDATFKTIDAMPTIEAVQRWVPVTECEPDGGAHVLVTLRWAADDYEVTEIDWFFDVANGGLFADKVIAWMPLPEPYREVEE